MIQQSDGFIVSSLPFPVVVLGWDVYNCLYVYYIYQVYVEVDYIFKITSLSNFFCALPLPQTSDL